MIKPGSNYWLRFYSHTCVFLLTYFVEVESALSSDEFQYAKQVTLNPPELVVMAKHLSQSDDSLKRNFATLALITIRQSYADELDLADNEEAPKSKKLSRWYQAARDYIGRISELQLSIEAGGDFSITVTQENLVLIIAQGKQVLLSGPTGNDADIFLKIKSEYCRIHDCDWLKQELVTQEVASKSINQGVWIFSQKQTPTFEVNLFQFVFKNFSQKALKQLVAYAAVDELNAFLMELRRAKNNGYLINWASLSQGLPAAGVDQTVFLNEGDVYLRLNVPLLMHLEKGYWSHLLKWLKISLSSSDVSVLVIEQADSLLNADRSKEFALKIKAAKND